ncbi:uncharacterized protein LOC122327397 isoform X2 [Puntigrus tetrazona]|uniref:uncharacterized protein LOC122327397 isoform X2 n=1 Tax=Puntigrus tetrazona TaxID=1606681 RepID=UPI001C8961C8|nr:uncharacterized protein LOC122327397 isoform X2 [Puntigrus tetrazona]
MNGLHLLLWWFGDKGYTVAQIDGIEISYEDYELFRDRLELDQTGSLTITNTRTKHSGLYKAEINHSTGTLYIKFSVTVYESPSVIDAGEAERQLMSVKEGVSVTLNIPQLQGNELIVWRSGDEGKLVAKLDKETKSSPLYYDERFRDRLELEKTGSLIITNTRTTDSGLYRVKISSNKQTLYKRFTVTVNEPGLSSAAVAGIVLSLLLTALAAATGGLFYLRKKSELDNLKSEISKRQTETLEISEKLKEMSRISEKLNEMSDDSERLKDLSKHCEKEMHKISDRLKEMSSKTKEQISEQETPLSDAVIMESAGKGMNEEAPVLSD